MIGEERLHELADGWGVSLESLREWSGGEGLKTPVCLLEQGWCCRQIDGRGLNIDVPQEGGKREQPRLRV